MITVLVTIAVIFLSNLTTVYAAPLLESGVGEMNPLVWDFSGGDYHIWSDGAEVHENYVNGKLEVTVDATNNDEQDYYSAYIYKLGSFNLADYGEITFDFNNTSAEPMKINFILTDNYYVEHRLTDSMPVLILSEGSSLKELILSQWGAVEIPPGFKGKIHIPDYNVTEQTLENIVSFGISITVPKNALQSFVISNVRLIPNQNSSLLYGFRIEGDREIQMPMVGESISFYQVIFNDVYTVGLDLVVGENVLFSLNEEITGVSITKDGKLTIDDRVKEYHFSIHADINDEIRSTTPIALIDHWSKDIVENGRRVYLPKPNEINPLLTENNLFFDMGTVSMIRYICLACAIALSGLYFWWRRKARLNPSEGSHSRLYNTFGVALMITSLITTGCTIRPVKVAEPENISEITNEGVAHDQLEITNEDVVHNQLEMMMNYDVEEEIDLGRGINIGNALESPKGICWGVEMKAEYFDFIKEAGFDTVRMPVRFSGYCDGESYKIEEDFMTKIDYYIQYALSKGLNLILDFHHFEEIMINPEAEKEKLFSIWEQISERYKDYPNKLIFEILNEPKEELKGEMLNHFIANVVDIIRKTNPNRLIIVGGEQYNSIAGLETLRLPEDENIIVTFHYYEPSKFAFQGDPYHKGFEHLKSIKWVGSEAERQKLKDDFTIVKNWAAENNVRVFLGEFGIVKTVPSEYRDLWIKSVKDMAEEMGFSWSYWELASHFGIFNDKTSEWDMGALQSLIP